MIECVLRIVVKIFTTISSTQSIIAHDHGYRCLQTRYHPRAFLDGASFAPLKRAERDQQPDQISLGRTKTHMCTFTPWPYASRIVILCPRCSSMPRAVDSCLVEAARLRRSGAEWDASFEEAGVEDALHVGAVGCQVRPSGAAAAPTPTPVLGAAAPGIT